MSIAIFVQKKGALTSAPQNWQVGDLPHGQAVRIASVLSPEMAACAAAKRAIGTR